MLVLVQLPALISEPVSARQQTPQRVAVWRQPTARQVLILDQGPLRLWQLALVPQQTRQRVSPVRLEPVLAR